MLQELSYFADQIYSLGDEDLVMNIAADSRQTVNNFLREKIRTMDGVDSSSFYPVVKSKRFAPLSELIKIQQKHLTEKEFNQTITQAFQNRLQYFPELCVSLKKWSEEEDYGENYFAMLTDIKEGVKLPYFYKNGKKAFKSKEWIKNPNKAKKNLKTIWQY